MTGLAGGSRSAKRGLLISAILSSVALGGCGKSDRLFSGHADHDRHPEVYDVDLKKVSPAGCLDLSALHRELASLSTTAGLLHYTTDFDVAPAAGEKNQPRRNFSAVSAFANFTFRSTDLRSAVDALPVAVQDACKTVTFKNDIEGDRVFSIKDGSDVNSLHLIDSDGAQLIYKMNAPRELEVTTIATVIDFCPAYNKAETKRTEVLRWGPAASLSTEDISVSRAFLKRISLAISQMPEDISQILLQATTPTVKVAGNKLASLSHASVAPEMQTCPTQVSPPAADEAPPARDPAPTPVPSDPARTPAPADPTPAPTPAVAATPAPEPPIQPEPSPLPGLPGLPGLPL